MGSEKDTDDAGLPEEALDGPLDPEEMPGITAPLDDPAECVSTETLLSRLESILFVSPEPVTVRRLARILGLEGASVRELLGTLGRHYENRGIILQEVSGGFQFRSHPDNAAVIRYVFRLRPLRMSRAAMETLSIVAYRQPVTRVDVEAVRGVDCGGTLKYLFEKELVRVIGRKEEPGRPIIYGTSKQFLELFGLKALSDLPALHEFSELWAEHQEMVEEEAPMEGDIPSDRDPDTDRPPTEEPLDSMEEEGEEE